MGRMPKLIASDLDGTLLQNGAQSLRPETCGLIHRLVQQNVVFLASSGRQYDNLQRLFAPVSKEIAYLCENGCLAFFEEEMIVRETMDRALGEEIIRAIMDREGCEVLLSGIHTSYLQPKESSYYYHMRDVVKNNVTLVEDIFSVDEPYFKISVYEKNGLQDIPYWEEKFGDRCTVVTGGAAWLDLMPKNIHKGSAMKQILEKLDIDPEDCMAFGDNYNDTQMMELVGCPIAVNNAKPEIIQMSKYTTDTVEQALENILAGDGYDW